MKEQENVLDEYAVTAFLTRMNCGAVVAPGVHVVVGPNTYSDSAAVVVDMLSMSGAHTGIVITVVVPCPNMNDICVISYLLC